MPEKSPNHSKIAILSAGILATIILSHAALPTSAENNQPQDEASTTSIQTDIPNLLGTWSGENNTISDKKGYKTWNKTIEITEQKDRRFKGHFTYSAGRKDFFGVIYPDNISFTWVVPNSRGYNHGRILTTTTISACYVESGIDATAGCAELTRQ